MVSYIEELKFEIDDLRSKLNELVYLKDIIVDDEEILRISMELDKLIYAFICLHKEGPSPF
jgi:hypothetical protein